MARPIRGPGGEKKAATRLALKAALIWGALSALYALCDWRFTPLTTRTAHVLARCLSALGLDAQVDQATVAWNGGQCSFVIIPECTGIFGLSILAAFVLATPAGMGARLIGLAAGAVAVAILNLARLVLLALVQTHAPQLFPVAHDYLWQIAFVLGLAGVYGAWLGLMLRSTLRAPDAAPSLPG
jgi:exosortase/archaeosortase family protein